MKKLWTIYGLFALSACSYGSNSSSDYSSYNCNQLSMERYTLNDELQQASGEQSSHMLYQLGMAAFAMSNGSSYNATPDSHKTDQLNAQLSAVRHEAIRKQCNWYN